MQVNGHKYPDHYRRSYACLGTFECRECGNIDRPRTQRGVQGKKLIVVNGLFWLA